MVKVKVKVLLVLFCLFWLVACTPEYNWRELTVADDRAVVMFPSRVKTEQRTIQVDGLELVFSLTSAAVDQSVFSVGYAPLSSTLDSAQTERLVQAFATALAARVGQPLVPQALKGEVFELESVVAGQPSRLLGRVLIHRGMLIQAVVSGPKKSLSKENATEFMRSLVLR
ncbi:MAG: hypothetical protein K9J49_01315 [Candidatus Methylopumilus sp.]|nr:hypothetical protein [Candidatus Methylopumilus sp.]